MLWAVDLWRRGERRLGKIAWTAGLGMVGFVAVMLATDWVVTGLAMIRPSSRTGSHPSAPGLGWFLEQPMPQDWVGFATQLRHQRNGGPSYLLGERRMTGWWYYYPVALAVKVPLGCWLLLLGRLVSVGAAVRTSSVRRPRPEDVRTADPTGCPRPGRDWLFPLAIAAFLAIAMFGSKRNYGVRYLLPMAPLAIVWMSALAERRGIWRWIVGAGLIGQAIAIATIHPHELSYFNALAGGKIGGRHILADSNLDWGQGLRSFAELEKRFPPITLFYFGDTDPTYYGVESGSYLVPATGSPRSMTAHRRWQELRRVNPKVVAGPITGPITATSLARMFAPDFDPFGRQKCRESRYFLADEFPEVPKVTTPYLALSTSLQHGPWGPDDFFRPLDGLTPVAYTDDGTIAIYHIFGTDLYRHWSPVTYGGYFFNP